MIFGQLRSQKLNRQKHTGRWSIG